MKGLSPVAVIDCHLCKLFSVKTGERCRSVKGQAVCQRAAMKWRGSGGGSITASTLCVEVCGGPDSC